jgi:hypothetical protein
MFRKNRPALTPSDRWTPNTQRRFLEVLAQTGSIKRACGAVSMSRQAVFMPDRKALANIPIQCQLPEKSAISEMAISSPLAPRAMSGHRAASP